jgi:Uma2 family endonuclease
MATTTATKRWTYADLDGLPESEDGSRYEIIDGELVVTPSPIPPHQASSGGLFFELESFVRPRRLGRVLYAPVDVKPAEDEPILIPDLVFVARERLGIIGPKAIEGAPDLVVEILSPSTRERDLGVKRAIYARYGVREYWLVDLDARRVTGLVLRGGRYEPRPQEGGIARSEVLPGLAIDVVALFAAAGA